MICTVVDLVPMQALCPAFFLPEEQIGSYGRQKKLLCEAWKKALRKKERKKLLKWRAPADRVMQAARNLSVNLCHVATKAF